MDNSLVEKLRKITSARSIFSCFFNDMKLKTKFEKFTITNELVGCSSSLRRLC